MLEARSATKSEIYKGEGVSDSPIPQAEPSRRGARVAGSMKGGPLTLIPKTVAPANAAMAMSSTRTKAGARRRGGGIVDAVKNGYSASGIHPAVGSRASNGGESAACLRFLRQSFVPLRVVRRGKSSLETRCACGMARAFPRRQYRSEVRRVVPIQHPAASDPWESRPQAVPPSHDMRREASIPCERSQLRVLPGWSSLRCWPRTSSECSTSSAASRRRISRSSG